MIDFLVIGGGIAGLSAAARLAELGSSVTVLEGEDALAYHASGRSAALYEANYGKPSTIALNKVSLDYHQQADVLSPRGLLLIGTPDTGDEFAHDQTTMALHPITVAEALDLMPILDPKVIDRAAHDFNAQDIDTDKLVQSFAKTLRAKGGTIVTKARVSAIKRGDTGWVVSAGEDYAARHIVNAAGAWGDHIARLAEIAPMGLQPLRRSMGRIPAPGGHDVTKWPMLFGPGENWYAKPDAGCMLVSPADETPVDPHDAFADDLTLAEGFARYEAHVTEPVTRLLSSWAGLRTFAPDGTLVIGPDPDTPDFIWCVGQGGYGMQSSPGASQLLADLISGHPALVNQDTIDALSPQRFNR